MADQQVQPNAPLDQDLPGFVPGDQPPPYVPPRLVGQRPAHGLQFIRAPPILKLNMDLDNYLRRFQSYTNSIGAQPNEIPHILINSLDDEVMTFIERHLADNITYAELTRVLRQEMGVARVNREDYKAKLRKTLRGRHEDVRSFYSKLWTLAKKAYPDNQQVRDANLRDVFVANFQDSQISTRLRENNQLNNEQLLDLAVNLLNCKNASISRQSEVNASLAYNSEYDRPDFDQDDIQSSFNYRPPAAPAAVNASASNTIHPNSTVRANVESGKIDQVIELLTSLNVNKNVAPSNSVPAQSNASLGNGQNPYQYQGDRRSIGLDRGQGYYNRNFYNRPSRPFMKTRPQGRQNFRSNRGNGYQNNYQHQYNNNNNGYRYPQRQFNQQPQSYNNVRNNFYRGNRNF